MKKALAILMAFALVAPALFAVGPAPEVTFGLSADAKVQVIKESTDDTFEKSGDASKPVATENPMGLQVTKFASNQWVNLDWAPFSIKTEGKWDAFAKNDGDDYSWLYVTATWKDLFGFKIDYTYKQDTKKLAAVNPNLPMTANNANEITATYDKDGVKFYTVYDATQLLKMASVTAGANIDSFLNDFKKVGFEFTNDDVATKFVWTNNPASLPSPYGAKIDTATVEAKNLFGMWSVLLNNSDEIGYRLANLDSDSKLDRSMYKIGKDNKIQYIIDPLDPKPEHVAMNAKNTVKIGENLTAKATFVVPNAAATWSDWLKGDNLILGAEYVLADVGTLGAGAKVSQDYVASPTGATSGPTKLLAQALTTPADFAAGKVINGSAFWLDAKLDKLLGEGKAVFVGVDAQLGYYNKAAETTKFGTDNPGKVAEIQVGNTTVVNLYGETKLALTDAISLSAGTLFSMGMGYDLKGVNGNNYEWTDPTEAQKALNWYNGHTEANYLNATYNIKPFELKARADVKINDTVSVWVSDNFVANAGEFKAADGTNTVGLGKSINGFYQKNVIGLGAKLKASEKAKLTVSTDINLFLGLPTAGNLETTGMTDAQKAALKSAHAKWVSDKFNPFALNIAYSYAY